jgi:hypothetical protein
MAYRINPQFKEFGPVIQAGLPMQQRRPDREKRSGRFIFGTCAVDPD